jgi:hypothetical protein
MRYLTDLFIFVILTPMILNAQIFWTRHTIADDFGGACSVHAQDINDDGFVDVLATGIDGQCVALWTNNGNYPVSWTYQTIDSNFTGACFVFAEDVDGDDDVDVLGSAWYGHELAWWENGGGNPISWTKHTVEAGFYNAHEVTATDMDGDNDIDVLGASAALNEIAWFENDGLNPIGWTKHTIGAGFGGARSVKAVDIDGDGLKDAVGAALLANAVTWWRNNGDSTWTEYPIDSIFGMAHMVYSFDIDADGDSDVVAAGYTSNSIAWWRNDGGMPIQWTKQTIDGSFLGALGVYVKDINNDGHLDVLGAADFLDDVAWWSNDGNSPISWTRQVIDGICNGAWPVYAEDIDGDGDNDVLAAARASDDIYWYESDLVGINEIGKPYLSTNRIGPTIIRGPLHLDDGGRNQIYDIAGRPVSPQQMKPGVYFIVIDGEPAGKVIQIK